MPKNIEAAKAQVYKFIEAVLPGSENKKIYDDFFARMDEGQFDEWVKALEEGKANICIIAPEGYGPQLSFPNNLKVAKQLYNHSFYKRVWMKDPHSGAQVLSNEPYLVIRLNLKRQAQFLVKKISIPEDNYSINNLTGQPTGKSKGSTISNPELQILDALGFKYAAIEMIKMRGGDTTAFNAMNNSISQSGVASIEAIDSLGTNVKAVQSLSTILTAMHLSNTLMKKS